MAHTHLTAPTRFADMKGGQFTYRRWGNTTMDQPPLFSCSISVAAWAIGTRS